MANTDLDGIQLAAALAEHVYRRGNADSPIDLSGDLNATGVNRGELAGFQHSLLGHWRFAAL